MAGQPKPMFYVAVAVVVLGLIGFAIYRSDLFAPEGEDQQANQGDIDPKKLGTGAAAEDGTNVTAPTTLEEYTFVPAEKLPPVTATAAYKEMENNTVRFALNVWAGWAPIIFANDGFAANKVWKTPDGKDFRVELALIDDPVAMQNAFVSGQVHVGWGTLDMLPLYMQRIVDDQGKPKDSRVMPRIYQQVDWSCGGDGIIVRENIQSVGDLRGETIALAQSSPSHYFALNMLVSGGVQPSEVKMVFTPTAFEAATAFNTNKDIAAAVSWAPDIYNLEKVQGNRLLVTTATANKLIADVWFARADFAKDHPAIIEGLVRGIFDAMEALKDDDAKQNVAKLMGDGYQLPPAEALAMLGDAHSTNWAENYQFFVNQNNPANFERIWNQAYYLYSRIGKIKHRKVPFDQVMDYSIIKKLGEQEKYSSQKDEYTMRFTPRATSAIRAEDEILTNTVVIHFYPNEFDPYYKDDDGQLYDPNVDLVLEEIAKLAGQFSSARIIIEGHTDSSMKGRSPESMVKELSDQRANAVKVALVNKFDTLDPNQFNVEGMGWDRPADPDKPLDQAKNRRVEIKIFQAEAGG